MKRCAAALSISVRSEVGVQRMGLAKGKEKETHLWVDSLRLKVFENIALLDPVHLSSICSLREHEWIKFRTSSGTTGWVLGSMPLDFRYTIEMHFCSFLLGHEIEHTEDEVID